MVKMVISKTLNKNKMLNCNYAYSMLSTNLSTNCAPICTNADILITLGKTSAENKGLEFTIAYNNIESRFPNHVFIQPKGISVPQ